VGLMVIPYIDINPKGNGYYCFKDRKYEIITFYLGFHILWVSLIIIGTFLRGPGWNWFWFWQPWDAHKVEAMTAVDLPYLLGARTYWTQFTIGAIIVVGVFVGGTALMYWWIVRLKGREFMRRWGAVRFGITAFLFLNMWAVVFKMLMRHLASIKYVWVTPWINI